MTETKLIRQQASNLLLRLIDSRSTIEQRITDSGRRDPVKSITGRSSIDEAISSTRKLLSHMDTLLLEAEEQINSLETPETAREFSPAAAFLK